MAVVCSGAPGGGQVWHEPALTRVERSKRWGKMQCRMPVQLVAGASVDVEFTFLLGEQQLEKGSALRVAWRWPFDWDCPTCIEIDCEGAEVVAHFEPQGDLNPWHHHIQLMVVSGVLGAGAEIVLRCLGWDAPTFITRAALFLPLIGIDEKSDWYRMVDPEPYDIVAGPASRLVVIAEGEVSCNQDSIVRVYGEDRWGNPAPLERASALSGAEKVIYQGFDKRFPVHMYKVRFCKEGVYRMHACSAGLEGESNPIRIVSPNSSRLYWGDLHAGQSDIGCGAGTLGDHFAFARDVAGLQFASQQANDHYIDGQTWQEVRAVSHALDESGRFVCYLGCEWSPFTEDGGDRNVFYRADEPHLRRSDRFFSEDDPDPEPDFPQAPEFLRVMRERDVLLGLHVGGRPTNLDFHEPHIEPLFEIHSTHGTSEWFVLDAIRRGYRVGITGGTDGVMGRPGACHPGRRLTRNVNNGLTAIRADELSRSGLWSALKARQCYATSGARILLDVEADGHKMGSEYVATGVPELHVQVEGTAPIERIDVLCDTDIVYREQIAERQDKYLRVLWGGAESEGTAGDQRVHWDGTLSTMQGTLSDLVPVGLLSPLDQVELRDDRTVKWCGSTGGNEMCFTFCVEDVERLFIQTLQGSVQVDVKDALEKTQHHALGGASKRMRIEAAPRLDGQRQADLRWRAEELVLEQRAYWVRVIQVDGQRAWSSPIYVHPASDR